MKIAAYESVLEFFKRHERPLATVLFVSGFITDVITFGFLNVSKVTILFAIYLVIVIVLTLIAHRTYGRTQPGFTKGIAVLAPLLAQFTFGSLLSGFVIFYTKSAVLSVSWPFILLLIIVFFGNEIFRNYREHLVFQTLLLYFSLYAFAVFALPLYAGHIGTGYFLASTGISLAVFALYLFILSLGNRQRLTGALRPIILSVIGLTIAIVLAYLANLLPPIPLTLKDGGIYHSIVHDDQGYTVSREALRSWYDPRPQMIHHVPGTPLYAYSAIFAPISFSTGVVHRWQWYDSQEKKWTDQAVISFTLSGGREEGYRGYSIKSNPHDGSWRVRVETQNGEVIGQMKFTIQSVANEPVIDKYRK